MSRWPTTWKPEASRGEYRSECMSLPMRAPAARHLCKHTIRTTIGPGFAVEPFTVQRGTDAVLCSMKLPGVSQLYTGEFRQSEETLYRMLSSP